MSLTPADPKQTHALLVGIETYAAGDEWTLDGPARDVAEIHKWLTGHGVPADQICTLVAPLPKNIGALEDADVKWGSPTSRSVARELTNLHEQNGELLVLFWAGHGAIQLAGDSVIQNKEHRLFTTDATTEEKKNFEWASLRNSLASDYFAGFRRQIVIVDACANFRKDFRYTTQGESITAGKDMLCEQFVFFAARPGETAKNLGDEGRGLFSRELLRVLGEQPGDAWPPDMDAVARRVQQSFQALLERGDAAQMPRFDWTDSLGSTRTFLPPDAGSSSPATFALVIGVSEYEFGIDPNQKMESHQFPQLEAAAQDAQAMYRFLTKQPGYVVAEPLLNEKATRAAILQALDNVRKECQQPGVKKAVVQIFFSGHGARDDAGRSYLVPYDGRRDQLFATALWDKTLDAALREIPDARVVLLLDACDSGVGAPQEKGGPSTFDPRSLAGDKTAGGRYVLASCQLGQSSYEIRGDGETRSRGIFASHLLKLLGEDADRGDDDEGGFAYPFRNTEIDLFDLFGVLKRVVPQTARLNDVGPQEPFANFTTKTGICFSNRVLQRRRHKHLEKIKPLIRRLEPDAPVGLIEGMLLSFLESGKQERYFEEFYECFEEGALETTSREDREIYARQLLRKFTEGKAQRASSSSTFLRPPTSGDSTSRAAQAGPQAGPTLAQDRDVGPAGPEVKPTDVPQPSSTSGPAPVLPPVATPMAAAVGVATTTRATARTGVSEVLASGAERRTFSSDDVRYMLEGLLDLESQFDDATQLESCRAMYDAIFDALRQTLTAPAGVSTREVGRVLLQIRREQNPPGWDPLEAEINRRFEERWPRAQRVGPMTTVGIRNFTG